MAGGNSQKTYLHRVFNKHRAYETVHVEEISKNNCPLFTERIRPSFNVRIVTNMAKVFSKLLPRLQRRLTELSSGRGR